MCAGGGPTVIGRVGREAGLDWVHLDVAEGGGPMVVVEDAGEEATLPEMTAKFLGGVAVGGVLPVDVHHEQGNGVRAVGDGDEVEVNGHEGVSGDVSAAVRTPRSSLCVSRRLRRLRKWSRSASLEKTVWR